MFLNRINNVRCEEKERADKLRKRLNKDDERIATVEQRKKLFALKHKEIDNLRFQDQEENLEYLKNQRYKNNCELDEKHIALSVMNTDKKQFFQ